MKISGVTVVGTLIGRGLAVRKKLSGGLIDSGESREPSRVIC